MTENVYEFYKSRGICTRCGTADATHGVICEPCRNKRREYARKCYAEDRKLKVCTKCGNPKKVGNHTTCLKCRKADRERKSNQYVTARILKRCTRCDVRLGERYDKTRCPDCVQYENELGKKYQKKYYERKVRQGKCVRCGKKFTGDYLSCYECLDRQAEYKRRKRAKTA